MTALWRRGSWSPCKQGRGILAEGELFHLLQEGLQRPADFQRVVVPCRGGIGRKKNNVRHIVIDLEIERGEIQHRGDEHDAVQIQAVALLEITRKTCRTRGPVAFPDQEFGREPAGVTRGIQPDKISDRLDILLEAVPLLGLLPFHRPRIAGADRIDEDQVGFLQQGVFIIHQPVRRLGQTAVELHRHPARPQQPQVQPNRG